MPGTKWCGPGWRTDKAVKFGGYAASDRCCRHHDLVCPLSINPGETLYGLLNDKFHAVMHCSCDDRFRSCLKMVNNQAADDGEKDDDGDELSFSEFKTLLCRMANAKIPASLRGGEPFEYTWQAFLQLVFLPKVRAVMKDMKRGLVKKTL